MTADSRPPSIEERVAAIERRLLLLEKIGMVFLASHGFLVAQGLVDEAALGAQLKAWGAGAADEAWLRRRLEDLGG